MEIFPKSRKHHPQTNPEKMGQASPGSCAAGGGQSPAGTHPSLPAKSYRSLSGQSWGRALFQSTEHSEVWLPEGSEAIL